MLFAKQAHAVSVGGYAISSDGYFFKKFISMTDNWALEVSCDLSFNQSRYKMKL